MVKPTAGMGQETGVWAIHFLEALLVWISIVRLKPPYVVAIACLLKFMEHPAVQTNRAVRAICSVRADWPAHGNVTFVRHTIQRQAG